MFRYFVVIATAIVVIYGISTWQIVSLSKDEAISEMCQAEYGDQELRLVRPDA